MSFVCWTSCHPPLHPLLVLKITECSSAELYTFVYLCDTQIMSTLKFGEQEAGEELMSAALYVEEGQEEDEGAPQDGMAYLR